MKFNATVQTKTHVETDTGVELSKSHEIVRKIMLQHVLVVSTRFPTEIPVLGLSVNDTPPPSPS